MARQPWIYSAGFDLGWILGPSLFASLAVIWLRPTSTVGPWVWILVVLMIDVAHVYGSLFRTYLDSDLRAKTLLWAVPLFCWAVGCLIYSLRPAYFWMALAYLAVFHFVRQQYGFMMIYARGERALYPRAQTLDRALIYTATLYPLLYWHTHLPRRFNWFAESDFVPLPWPWVANLGASIYALLWIGYLIKEVYLWRAERSFNLPRNLLILGTALSWYVGIVWLNHDLAFTLTNVVSHGVPYMALIWVYGRRRGEGSPKWWKVLFRPRFFPLYLGGLILLAYLEEGFWDGLIWHEHARLFSPFEGLPNLDERFILTLLIPLLALPQSTHYVFDAFLWRARGPDSTWKNALSAPKNERGI